ACYSGKHAARTSACYSGKHAARTSACYSRKHAAGLAHVTLGNMRQTNACFSGNVRQTLWAL
ncbi:22279_t:CDS:1, partial [Rhizophagus irregularis]